MCLIQLAMKSATRKGYDPYNSWYPMERVYRQISRLRFALSK